MNTEKPAYMGETIMPVSGIAAMVIPAITDGEESWYGVAIDKSKLRIGLEDETEDTVYLKLVKIQQTIGEE